MPSPSIISANKLCAMFGYDVDTMTPEAIRQQACRLRNRYGLKVKDFGKRIGFRYYLSSVESAIASQPDHQFQAAA